MGQQGGCRLSWGGRRFPSASVDWDLSQILRMCTGKTLRNLTSKYLILTSRGISLGCCMLTTKRTGDRSGLS
jgi:hypothetical protein